MYIYIIIQSWKEWYVKFKGDWLNVKKKWDIQVMVTCSDGKQQGEPNTDFYE